ncbi:MAG: hypothetical protein ACO2O1_06780 [Candidatus Caldarchaeales archaeon]|jgi:hypothetical protein
MTDGEGSEQKKEENRLVKRAGRRREQRLRASREDKRTILYSEQIDPENRLEERAKRDKEQNHLLLRVFA